MLTRHTSLLLQSSLAITAGALGFAELQTEAGQFPFLVDAEGNAEEAPPAPSEVAGPVGIDFGNG